MTCAPRAQTTRGSHPAEGQSKRRCHTSEGRRQQRDRLTDRPPGTFAAECSPYRSPRRIDVPLPRHTALDLSITARTSRRRCGRHGDDRMGYAAEDLISCCHGSRRGTRCYKRRRTTLTRDSYAADPTGQLAWHSPKPAVPWSGVRDASSFGPAGPQLASTNGPRSDNPDCLVINVWRPTGTKEHSNLPVHVFIHGGASLNGNGSC